MTTPTPVPKRVRVTRSRRAARHASLRSPARDLDEQTALGDVYLASLMRAQLRLSLFVVALAVVGVGGLPLLLLAIPSTRKVVLLGLPFPWLVLGMLVYPSTWLVARWYAGAAERVERQFRDVLGPS